MCVYNVLNRVRSSVCVHSSVYMCTLHTQKSQLNLNLNLDLDLDLDMDLHLDLDLDLDLDLHLDLDFECIVYECNVYLRP